MDLHATNPGTGSASPEGAHAGGIFAATAPARWCRPDQGPEAATSERDVRLATKLNVPGLRPDLVSRPRLAQRLGEGLGQGLAVARARELSLIP